MNPRLHRARGWIALAGLVLVTALLLALGTARSGRGTRLEPGNPAPEGGQALAQILGQHGVDVHRVTRSDQVAGQASAGGTVLVIRSNLLGARQLDRLQQVPGPLVLIEPDAQTLSALVPAVTQAGQAAAGVVDPQCGDPGAQAAGAALSGGVLYRPRPGTRVTVCFPQPGTPGAGSYLLTGQNGRTITVIGQGDLMTNGELAHEGNAALALRAVGSRPSLIWYLPDPLESGQIEQRRSLRELMPAVVWWMLAELGVAVLMAMVWRGRRMGRLVGEPLPVVVQAAETQLGRARLYRQAHARGRAADALRTAALRRLAGRLAAPETASAGQLVELVSGATGWPVQDVSRVLLGPAPRSDLELVQLADRLDDIERLAAPRLGQPTVSAGERRP